jgi:hypothetical protein
MIQEPGKKPFSEEGCAAILTIGILLFAFMPIIGTLWILLKGWANTPDWVKAFWLFSILVIGGILVTGVVRTTSDQLSWNRAIQVSERTGVEILDVTLGNVPTITMRITNGDAKAHRICMSGSMWAIAESKDQGYSNDAWWIAHERECKFYQPQSSAVTDIGPFENIMAGEFGPSYAKPDYVPYQICVQVYAVDDEDGIFFTKWTKDGSLSCTDPVTAVSQ